MQYNINQHTTKRRQSNTNQYKTIRDNRIQKDMKSQDNTIQGKTRQYMTRIGKPEQ